MRKSLNFALMNRKTIAISLMFCLLLPPAWGQRRGGVLRKTFLYAAGIDTTGMSSDTTYAYRKFSLNVRKKNFTLRFIPSMYAVARGGRRNYFGEGYSRTDGVRKGQLMNKTLLTCTTLPHSRSTLPTVPYFLSPEIYRTAMINGNLLSPFNRNNRRFYRYRTIGYADGTTEIIFRPRLDNTQLVSGKAIADNETGRIISAEMRGEYDMVRFEAFLTMGTEGYRSLRPERCELNARFKFMLNDIRANYKGIANLPRQIRTDTITDSRNFELMELVRPEPLTPYEQTIRAEKLNSDTAQTDTAQVKKKKSKVKEILWDNIGENLVTHIRTNFGGPEHQGYVRISPILNPFYWGYNHQLGYYYKTNIRAGYSFNTNQSIWLQFKGGYSFKEKFFYFKIPMELYFDKRHNGYIEAQIGNGSRITNSMVIDRIKDQKGDSIKWDELGLDYFKDSWQKFDVHYDLSRLFSLRVGLFAHKRGAVNPKAQIDAGLPISYRSVAPDIELTYRPIGYNGPTLTALYERSFNGFLKSNIAYERWEFDAQYKLPLWRLQTLSMRFGSGFYTSRGDKDIFLDYENFRKTTIPDGWNDEWSGEFELLNHNWYNASKYYIRGNFTYESPILVAAWIPFLGHFVELERLYFSILEVKKLHPYVELGYGLKTRAFSMGAFVAADKRHYRGFGMKFGFELFNDW